MPWSAGIDGRVVLEDGRALFDSDPLRSWPSTDADFSQFSRSVTAFTRYGSLVAFAVDEPFAASTENPSPGHDGAEDNDWGRWEDEIEHGSRGPRACRPIHVLDTRTGTVVKHFAGGEGPVRALDLVGELGTIKVALQTDSTVALWDGSRGSTVWSIPFETS